MLKCLHMYLLPKLKYIYVEQQEQNVVLPLYW